jgi:hypothetical protein
MVQRLARGPFKAEMRVRFPLALPTLPLYFQIVTLVQGRAAARVMRDDAPKFAGFVPAFA